MSPGTVDPRSCLLSDNSSLCKHNLCLGRETRGSGKPSTCLARGEIFLVNAPWHGKGLLNLQTVREPPFGTLCRPTFPCPHSSRETSVPSGVLIFLENDAISGRNLSPTGKSISIACRQYDYLVDQI